MSNKLKQTNEKRMHLWRNHLKEWSESGLSQNAYCRQNNLKPGRFTYWKNKIKNHNLPVEFVQVKPDADILNWQNYNGLVLNIKHRFQIEIPTGFSQRTLAQVLQVLEGI